MQATDVSRETIGLALHGGAGVIPGADYSPEIAHMRGLVEAGRDRLRAGDSALDVVVKIVAELEASGLYTAGRGSSPNNAGVYELDASVMDGSTATAGAVAALQGFTSPVVVARAVMERTPHVLLTGDGAATFARLQRMEKIDNAASWFTPAARHPGPVSPGDLANGTVGCVARDRQGRLAAATSTGGVLGKLPGRCGDTPIIGAGNWADARVAVSCTGQGEYFIRVAAAVQVAHRMRWLGSDVADAAQATLAELAALGGWGGLIAIDAGGKVTMPYVSKGMKRAALLADGSIISCI